jgi:hypothetical protein
MVIDMQGSLSIMDKTEMMALADRLGAVSGRCSNERDRETIIKAAKALRLAAGASAGAVSGEPVAWQWRGRMRGENWTCWVNGRTPNPIFEEAETRQLYTADQLPALTPEPVKAGPEGAIEDHPRGGTIWEAFSNLYGNGNLDDEDCAYIDRELVKWRGDKFAQSVKAGDEVMRELERELADCQGAITTIESYGGPSNETQKGNYRFYQGRVASLKFALQALSTTAPQPDNGARGNQSDDGVTAADELEYKFSCVLGHATGGKLSYTSYPKETMYDAVNEHIANCCQQTIDDYKEEHASDTAPAEPVAWRDIIKRPDERSLPTYGHIPWGQLGRDVVESATARRDDYKFAENLYPGHQIVPGINFNSLARIVDKYRYYGLPCDSHPPCSVDVEAIKRKIHGVYGVGIGTFAGGFQDESIDKAARSIARMIEGE